MDDNKKYYEKYNKPAKDFLDKTVIEIREIFKNKDLFYASQNIFLGDLKKKCLVAIKNDKNINTLISAFLKFTTTELDEKNNKKITKSQLENFIKKNVNFYGFEYNNYFFSNENVFRFLNKYYKRGDVNFLNYNKHKISLFATNRVVKDLGIYQNISKKNNLKCTVDKGVFKKINAGSGSYGDVFTACLIDKNCKNKVAVKKLELQDKDDLEAFWNEIYLQNLISFYGISPKILVAWTCKNNKGYSAFIIMDFIQKINKKIYATEFDKIIFVLKKQKIIHADLKDDNILNTSDGPRLIDFGLSFQYENGKVLPRFDRSFGVELYEESDYFNQYGYNNTWDKLFYLAAIYDKTSEIRDEKYTKRNNANELSDFIRKNHHVLLKWNIEISDKRSDPQRLINSVVHNNHM